MLVNKAIISQRGTLKLEKLALQGKGHWGERSKTGTEKNNLKTQEL